MRFDLGDEFNVVSESLAARKDCVVRQYDGGLALHFDAFMKSDGDDAWPARHDKRSIKAAGPGQGPTPRALTRRPTLAFQDL